MSEEKVETVKETVEESKDVMATVLHEDSDPVVSAKALLAVGGHFGHQARRWNPAMRTYIYARKNNAHIINLNKTVEAIQVAYVELKKIVEQGGKVLFVGTKPAAKDTVMNEATRSGSFYVNNRWLGGTMTNFKVLSHRIKYLKQLQDEADEGLLEKLPKKEYIRKNKEREKLNALLNGIKEMRKVPNAIVVVDSNYEHNAVHEAKKLHIPSFGLIDTNGDPASVTYPIPVNCEGAESIKLVIGLLADAVVAGKGGEVLYAYQEGSADKSTMKEILPSQLSPEDLKTLKAKVREDIYDAKRKTKRHRKVTKKRFIKKKDETSNASTPTTETSATEAVAPVQEKVESKEESVQEVKESK